MVYGWLEAAMGGGKRIITITPLGTSKLGTGGTISWGVGTGGYTVWGELQALLKFKGDGACAWIRCLSGRNDCSRGVGGAPE